MEADRSPGDGHCAVAEDGHGPESDQHGRGERQARGETDSSRAWGLRRPLSRMSQYPSV